MDEKSGSNVVDVGVDLSEFYMSVEWDILEVPAVRWACYIHKSFPHTSLPVSVFSVYVLKAAYSCVQLFHDHL